MSVDFSRFTLPKEQEYINISSEIARMLSRTSWLAYAIYGSSVQKGSPSFRAGFSDIDVFVLSKWKRAVPNFDHLQEYGEMLAGKNIWVPIQTHWTTERMFQSPLIPSSGYMKEVRKGANQWKRSRDFFQVIENPRRINDYKHDDIQMMVHFIRKTINSTIALPAIRRVRVPDLVGIHRIYEWYKRIFSVMVLLTRIIDGETRFSEKKPEIIRVFQEMTGADMNGDVLLDFDKRSKDVFTWIHFFYHQDIVSLRWYFLALYTEFEKITEAILLLPIKEERVSTYLWGGDK
jgi:hypothetical protein